LRRWRRRPEGEAARQPRQVVADVVTAARALHSFRIAGTVTDPKGPMQLTAAVAGPGRVRITARRAGAVADEIAIGPVTYLKASAAYYAAQPTLTPAQVARFSDRWLKLSTAATPGFASRVALLTDFSRELRCWGSRPRGLSVTGTGSVDGRAAVIVASDGSVPGSAPGKVYVAASGRPWLLRATVTGPRKPGGTGACAEPHSTVQSSDIRLSDFNQPVALTPPAASLDLTR
jgi:hypothetical protein